ncbi:hypothetical protein [Pseudonocardia sp. ICBG1293]|uniref:hypothetical protein n=1 Tax=Pseudonocardia sp. ICBG1293 TaxID=2844382 RepID=UPI0027E15120|nr:hypothetical protein [Pseudonocardia sp. ICBG1293]
MITTTTVTTVTAVTPAAEVPLSWEQISMVGGAALAAVLYVLYRIGHYLARVLEALATAAVVFVALYLAAKGIVLALVWAVRHWRTTSTVTVVSAWCWFLGWASLLAVTLALAAALGLWRIAAPLPFDHWAGRRIRSWWQRWAVYAPRMPRWLRSCNLTVPDRAGATVIQVNPLRRTATAPRSRPRRDQLPRILSVRSGPSWDEVTVRLVPGQTPEDFDTAARALAVARGVNRCQVRELGPNVVSIDYQRRNLLDRVIDAPALDAMAGLTGDAIDLDRVLSGATEYGTEWRQSIRGSHTLVGGATGAGKGSLMWAPLLSIAPAIRDGLVRVNGIDPKGMELAYGRRRVPPLRRHQQGRSGAARRLGRADGDPQARARRNYPARPDHRRDAVGDRGVRRDRRPAALRRRPQDPGGDHRADRLVDHPGPCPWVHRARVRAGADQGHRPGPGAVPAPHLPARGLQVPRRDGAGGSGV